MISNTLNNCLLQIDMQLRMMLIAQKRQSFALTAVRIEVLHSIMHFKILSNYAQILCCTQLAQTLVVEHFTKCCNSLKSLS